MNRIKKIDEVKKKEASSSSVNNGKLKYPKIMERHNLPTTALRMDDFRETIKEIVNHSHT